SRPTTPATGTGRTTPPAAGTPTSRAGGLRPVPDGPVAAAGSLDRPVKCDEASFLRAGQPFEGRDIIYVHGLATDHFKKGLVGPAAPARRTWPDHAADFLNPGQYFRTYAEEYWRRHIRENLFDPMAPSNGVAGWEFYGSGPPRYVPKSNRYLIVAWSSNQRLVVAQHALLEQIRLAMTTHKNVVTPPGYPAEHRRPFCANGCIVISHSTGGLLTSTAMAQAAAGEFGPGGAQIPAYMRAHVAFEDALSGSRLATAGWLLSQVQAPASPPSMLCRMQDYLLEQPADGVCSFNTGFLTNSILYDLMPIVTQTLWGDVLNATPVPTLTVAGGHPSGDYGDTSWLLPGLDDGVVSMNSACANPNPVFPFVRAPSGLSVSSFVQAFDMGIPVHRALKYFIAQRNHKHSVLPGPQYLAGACQPALSPTGMVMPATAFYSGTPHDARARYTNHFSFLQGAIDHSYDGGGKSGNYWPSSIQTQQQNGQPASVTRRYFDGSPISFGPNAEEMSAITDAAVYAQAPDGTYLVHPRFADQMGEEVRGRAIRFKLFGKKRTIWIWKRTYHLLNNWQTKQSSHFAYEYVGRR
ncbi:MAG TPA: hypothetical protein VD948_04260, partial [Rhodothermales bacterium]|nr:hypothetical protein [Rhodothermales bacterium]